MNSLSDTEIADLFRMVGIVVFFLCAYPMYRMILEDMPNPRDAQSDVLIDKMKRLRREIGQAEHELNMLNVELWVEQNQEAVLSELSADNDDEPDPQDAMLWNEKIVELRARINGFRDRANSLDKRMNSR